MSDLIKIPFVLTCYLLVAPALGFLLCGRVVAQRLVLGLMVFMTSWQINKFTMMMGSVERYRGHTKGFEASLVSVLGLALIVNAFLERRPDFRWLPGAARLWLLYCGLSMLSIFAAPNVSYTLMAGWKFTLATVILIGAYNQVRTRTDLRWLLLSLAFTLCVQAMVALKGKYIDGFYQVRGWFEHQNSLATWAYPAGLVLLVTCLSASYREVWMWLAGGFAAAGILVQSALSRAALAVFAVGAVLLLGGSALVRPTLHKFRIAAVLGAGAFGALLLSIDTIIGRMNDQGNEASAETRVTMNLASKAMLDASPIGIGWNNFALTINAPFPYGDVIDDSIRARGHRVDEDYAKGVVESHYWLLRAETGWPGFCSYLLFVTVTGWWMLRGAVRLRKARDGTAAFLMGVLVGYSLLYVHCQLERVLTQTKNLSLWMILIGVACKVATWKPETTAD